jgi:hypothetical protein
MLYKETIDLCSEIHTKTHVNTQCWQKVGILNVKPGGT